MAPLDFWYKNDSGAQEFIREYVKIGIRTMNYIMPVELKEDIRYLYKNGNIYEKSMIVTLLASLKMYFGGYDE